MDSNCSECPVQSIPPEAGGIEAKRLKMPWRRAAYLSSQPSV